MGLLELVNIAERLKKDLGSYEGKFLSAYNVALQKDEKENRQIVPKDYYRPSSMYGCKRMLFFMRKGAKASEKERDANLIGICDTGSRRHTAIQEIVAKTKGVKIIDLEQRVKEINELGSKTEFMGWNSDHTEARCKNEDLKIFFQPDGVFEFDGKLCILEIKTMTTYQFHRLLEPKEEHMIQATCYAMGMGVEYILFFYEDRNNTEHKPYLVKVTDEMRQLVIDKVDSVEDYLMGNVVPPKEDKCMYCIYKEECKKYKEEGMQYVECG